MPAHRTHTGRRQSLLRNTTRPAVSDEKMPSRKRWAFFLAYIRGETGEAGTGDDVSREVGRTDSVRPYLSGDRGAGGPLDMAKLGLVGAEATIFYNLRTHVEGPSVVLGSGSRW